MIGKRAALGTGFKGLQEYLLHGRKGAAPDRSVWTTTRNLPDPDPEKAAAVMRATANASTRTEKPVYHLSVSLAPGERLERADLERVADRLLQDLGLTEHQALIAEHADGAQQHIHVMVNRVHPDTGRAWAASHDYHRIETSLRDQERELGLRIVPGRHSPVPGHDRYLGTRPGRGEFAENVRELAGDSFRASSWQEVHASLSQKGLTLQPSRAGRGLVITDGQRYVAASRVGREIGRPRLEARLGPFEPASPDLRKIQEISRALMSRGRLEAMRSRYTGAFGRLGDALANHERAAGRLTEASRQLDAALGRAYRNPVEARQRIEGSLERRGTGATLKTLRERPTGAGKLRGRVASRERGQAREALRDRVPGAIRSYGSALQAEHSARRRLEPYRRNPKQPVLEAASRARQVLGRALRRLEELDRRYAPEKLLRAQAAAVVRRLGWRAVSRLIPAPALQALRVTVALAKAPTRILARGMERGLER